MLKAGGTSFRRLIEPIYGERLLRDYDDIPMSNRPEHARQRERRKAELRATAASLDAEIVFGHFIMSKYLGLRGDLRFATMLRDPAARIVSHYFHYLRHLGGPRNEILPDGISLLEFARLPRYHDMYRYLLGEVRIAHLDYIGLTESFMTSVTLFCRVFGLEEHALAPAAAATYLNRAGEYQDPIAYLRQHDLLEEVVASQRVNYALYEEAKARFADLCRAHGLYTKMSPPQAM